MKKHIFVTAALLAAFGASEASAVSYRGFLDGEGGITVKSHPDYTTVNGFGGVNTTHGLQVIRNLFVGLGGGFCYYMDGPGKYTQTYYADSEYEGVLQLYLDLRWDGFGLFGLGKRISPFVDLKAGYQGGQLSFSASGNDASGNYYYYGDKKWSNGMFLRPTIGVRFGIYRNLGINVGIFYDVINYLHHDGVSYHYAPGEDLVIAPFNATTNAFGLSVGLDF